MAATRPGVWWSVACGKSLYRNRCHPAAAAPKKDEGPMHQIFRSDVVLFLELDENNKTTFVSVPMGHISEFMPWFLSDEAPETGCQFCR